MRYIQLLLTVAIISLITGCTGPGWHRAAFDQFKTPSTGPILSIQGYVTNTDEKSNNLNKHWNDLANVMRQQPGFLSGHLSPGVGESELWLAHSKWESIVALRSAFSNPDVLRLESKMPKAQFEHLFFLDNNRQQEEIK